MSLHVRRYRWVLVLCACVVFTGCDDESGEGTDDTMDASEVGDAGDTADVAPDTAPDVDPDTTPDMDPDADVDVDVDPDMEPDVDTPFCGDGAVSSGEDCEPGELQGATCESLGMGFSGGALACDAMTCAFDVSGCMDASLCGNGMLDMGETCDGDCPTSCDPGPDACRPDVLQGVAAMCTAACVATPITACEMVGDGCCPAGCMGMDADCGPDTMPRLFVGDDEGLKVWDQANALTTDSAPDAASIVGSEALALAVHHDRMFIATTDMAEPVFIVDDASAVADGASADDALTATAVGGAFFTVYDMKVDANETLWIDDGDLLRFDGAATLGAASPAGVRYTHMWGPQIYAFAVDTVGDKLLGGQVSGAGVIVWDDPQSVTGVMGNEPDWTLEMGMRTPSQMHIVDGDLYVASYSMNAVSIWRDIATIDDTLAPRAADVVLDMGSSLTDVAHISVRDDVLVATVNDAPSGYQVNIYLNASGITGDVAPDFVVTHASMTLPTTSWIDHTDTLYVMDSTGVLIFSDATTAPTFQARVEAALSSPNDVFVMECSPAHPCDGGLTCAHGLCRP